MKSGSNKYFSLRPSEWEDGFVPPSIFPTRDDTPNRPRDHPGWIPSSDDNAVRRKDANFGRLPNFFFREWPWGLAGRRVFPPRYGNEMRIKIVISFSRFRGFVFLSRIAFAFVN